MPPTKQQTHRYQRINSVNLLVLVNVSHPLPQGTAPSLVPLEENRPDILADERLLPAYTKLMDAINGWGKVAAVSGFRTMAEQTRLYTESLQENGAAFTQKYVALPGHSEHQTGLAIDMALLGQEGDPITPSFPYHGVCQAFRLLAPRFGFILRYPKGKESITGIGHEPWHFRYVGRSHAEKIAKNHLTLEEYLHEN